jgi:hypothetical protein
MSTNESRSVEIIIKGTQAAASLKEIKAAAAVLSSELNKLPANSKEFVEKSKQLTEVTGRLDMIREQAKQARMEFIKLSGGLNNDKAVFESYAAELKAVQKEMQGLEFGSAAYQEAAKRAGELKDKISDAKEATKAFATDSKAGQIKNLLGGIGSSIKDLDFAEAAQKGKMLVSVIGSISVKEVISGLKNFGTTLMEIGKALILNPLMILAAVIAGIAKVSYDMVTAFQSVDVQTKTVTESILAQQKALTEFGDRVSEAYIKINEALGVYSKAQAAAHRDDIKNNKEILASKEKYSDDLKKLAGELNVDLTQLEKGRLSEMYKGDYEDLQNRKRFNLEKAKLDRLYKTEYINLTKTQLLERRALEIQDNVERGKVATEALKKTMDEANKANDAEAEKNRKEAAAKAAEKLREFEALQVEINKLAEKTYLDTLDKDARDLKAVDFKYAALLERAKGHADAIAKLEDLKEKEKDNILKEKQQKQADDAAKQLEQEANATAAEWQKKADDLKAKHDANLEQIKFYGLSQLEIGRLQLQEERDQILKDTTLTEEQRLKIKTEYAKRDAKLQKAKREQDLEAVSQLFGELAELAGENAEAQKTFAIGQALINTYLSATKAYQSLVGIPIVGPVLAVAGAGAAVVAGLKNVQKIEETKAYAAGGYNTSDDPQGWTTGPTLYTKSASGRPFIAGEKHGTEYIIPNWMIQEPAIANIVGQLETIRQSRSFASGGSTTSKTSTPVFENNSSSGMGLSELETQMRRLNDHLDNGIPAFLDWDGYNRTLSKINASKSASRIG